MQYIKNAKNYQKRERCFKECLNKLVCLKVMQLKDRREFLMDFQIYNAIKSDSFCGFTNCNK